MVFLLENLLDLKKKELLSTLEPEHSNDLKAHLNQPAEREIKTSGEVTQV